MLLNLHVKNLALIQEAEIDFRDERFNKFQESDKEKDNIVYLSFVGT